MNNSFLSLRVFYDDYMILIVLLFYNLSYFLAYNHYREVAVKIKDCSKYYTIINVTYMTLASSTIIIISAE